MLREVKKSLQNKVVVVVPSEEGQPMAQTMVAQLLLRERRVKHLGSAFEFAEEAFDVVTHPAFHAQPLGLAQTKQSPLDQGPPSTMASCGQAP